MAYDGTMDNLYFPSAAAKAASEPKRYTLIPTLIYWFSLGALSLGVIYSNGWLFLLGAVLLLPTVAIISISALTLHLGMRNMYRHPERYRTVISEDDQGNITGIKWVMVPSGKSWGSLFGYSDDRSEFGYLEGDRIEANPSATTETTEEKING